jgi:hypothetical protein
MGDRPISEQELAAWQANSGIELDAWEARTIRRLSKAYLAQRYAAEKPNCPQPYLGTEDDQEAMAQHVDAQIDAVFSGMRRQSD